MGNQVSIPCCHSPSTKYGLPLEAQNETSKKGKSLEAVPTGGAPAAPAGEGGQQYSAERSFNTEKSKPFSAFVTTDPLEVAAELAPQQGLPYQFHVCGPPLPPCDEMRLRTINALKDAGSVKMDAEAIDAPPDPEIASILKLVQSIFEAPAALVALFDDRRIFIRDAEGAFKRGDFPWRWSFCGWTMASKNDQIMVIPDATKDARFCDNAMVKSGPGIRFYCGTPLIASNGHRIGTLCFADVKPREFDASRYVVLNNLAELVVRHLEKDIALQLRAHDNNTLAAAYGNLRRTLDCFDHCVALLDTSTPGWRMLFVNNPCCKALGIDRDSLQGSYLSRLLYEMNGSMLPTEAHQAAADRGREFQVAARLSDVVVQELTGKAAHGEKSTAAEHRYFLTFRPASREDLDEGSISIGVPSFIPVLAKKEFDADDDSPETELQAAQRRPDRLYFMLLQDAVKIEAERAAAEAKADLKAANASAGLTTVHSSVTSLSYSQDKELSQPPESISGLTMGHLLGKGAYGSVYYGTWYGSPVAVKIIDEELPPGAESIAPIEAILSKELRHPHIVPTLRCARRIIGPGGSSHAVSVKMSAAAIAALRRGGIGAQTSCLGDFSDATACASQTNPSGSGVGGSSSVMVGSGSGGGISGEGTGGTISGGSPCVLPKAQGSARCVGGVPDSGWLPGNLASRAADSSTQVSIFAAGSSADARSLPPAGIATPPVTEGGAFNTSSALSASPSTPAGPTEDLASQSLPQGRSRASSQAGWAIINLEAATGTAQLPRRRSSAARPVVGDECGADAATGAANTSLDGDTDDSEAYDAFDAGRDSNMSPFLLPPGSHQGGGNAGGASSLPAHSGPSGHSEKWAHDEVLIRHQTWLIMEYCDRGCLQDAIDRGWLRMSPAIENSGPRLDAVLATAVELASALSFLHSKDIVHGDMSAWNVMLCTSGATASIGGRNFVAKIADFGLARHLDIRTKIRTRNYGTLTHMPAETLRDGVISKATDVYSMGVLLWQLYTSSRPWAGLRHGQIIVMVVTQGARLRFPPGCPSAYEDLAYACMDHDASRRPAIETVLAELEALRKSM